MGRQKSVWSPLTFEIVRSVVGPGSGWGECGGRGACASGRGCCAVSLRRDQVVYVQCGANATRSLLIRKYICVCMLRSITLDISLSPACSFDLIPSARTFEKDSARLFHVPLGGLPCTPPLRRTGGTCQHTTIMLHLQSHLRHRPLTLRGAPCPPCLCARLLSVGKRYLDRRTP